MVAKAEEPSLRTGVIYALLAYGSWGLFPMYWKQLPHVDPLEVLAQRVVWSFVFFAVVLSWQRRWSAFGEPFRVPRTMALLVTSTLLIAINWYLFVWAVAHGRVIDASFGYFLTPLMNMALGVLFQREHLSRAQMVAMALAASGVGWIALTQARFPWIALALASSFALYGFVRKRVAADALTGLAVETALMFVPAVVFLCTQPIAFGADVTTSLLLIGGGVVTALPLLWFAMAVRALPLTVIGFFQYIAPSVQFLLATVHYGEPFNAELLLGFACIWTALAIVSLALLHNTRRVSASVRGT